MPPLGALISGAVAFETPSVTSGTQAASGHMFTLYGSRNEADYAIGPDALLYRVIFGADAGGLADSAPVILAGRQGGSVKASALRFDATAGVLREQATIAIDPARLGLDPGADAASARRNAEGVVRRLVAQGLRAQLGSSVPLIGPPAVELVFVHDAPQADLTGNPPEIPVAPGGGDIQGVMAAPNGVGAKLHSLPLGQIAGGIHVATARLAELSQSPQLTASLEAMGRVASDLGRVGASARAEVPAILDDLRRTSREAESAVADVRQVMGSLSGRGPVGLDSASLGQTLYELTRAAQAMRDLADYLSRNPSALIRGRE
ncbi:MAG: hypothetical protein JOY66_00985 [Acetobacteraceae bacterium]|nr:hypothetical protein [Acetobacteraceae bacterium]